MSREAAREPSRLMARVSSPEPRPPRVREGAADAMTWRQEDADAARRAPRSLDADTTASHGPVSARAARREGWAREADAVEAVARRRAPARAAARVVV
jgi:hypothetical protein